MKLKTKNIISLQQVKVEEINKLKMSGLKQLCRFEGLPVKGKKAELVKRLVTKKIDSSKRFIGGGLTGCIVCSMPAKVAKTARQTLEDGRILITRTMRCTAKHHHTYPLKNIVCREEINETVQKRRRRIGKVNRYRT